MTYTFKLSSRLAMLWAPACAVAFAAAACTDGDMSSMSPFDQLGNGGTTSASTGAVSPKSAVIEISRPVQFSSGSGVSWTTTGGKISRDGTFSSSVAGSFLVVGRGKNRVDSARVTVVNPNQRRRLAISPREVQVTSGQSAVFSSTATLPNGAETSVDVNWDATGGTVDKAGNFVAGTTPGTFSVIVSAASFGVADTAVVTVSPGARQVVRMVLAPAAAVVVAGGVQRYTASAQYSDGTVAPAMVSFRASGGTVDAAGVFTAGGTPGAFEVTAARADGESTSVPVTVVGATSTSATPMTTTPIATQGPGSGTYPNQPSGFTPITDVDFSKRPGTAGAASVGSISPLYWGGDSTMTLVSDATAPQSGSGVLRTRMFAGLPAGDAPGHFQFWSSTPQDFREIYVSFWLRIPSADYENQAVYTKLFYFAHGNSYQTNEDVIALQGMGRNGPMTSMSLVFSHSQTDDRTLDVDGVTSMGSGIQRQENVNTTKEFTAGSWHHVEGYFNVGTVQPSQRTAAGGWAWDATGGRYDGVARMWLDGMQVMEYSPARGNGLKYLDAGYNFVRGFFSAEWTPVWGGTSGCGQANCFKTRTDNLDLDHLYISGRP